MHFIDYILLEIAVKFYRLTSLKFIYDRYFSKLKNFYKSKFKDALESYYDPGLSPHFVVKSVSKYWDITSNFGP